MTQILSTVDARGPQNNVCQVLLSDFEPRMQSQSNFKNEDRIIKFLTCMFYYNAFSVYSFKTKLIRYTFL